MPIDTTYPICVQSWQSQLIIHPTVSRAREPGQIQATIVTRHEGGNPQTPPMDQLVYALLDALEDCCPEAVGDWVWERGMEMGLVNPRARP